MAQPFRLFRQPPGSNSCLPTAVRAVLHAQGQSFSAQTVSDWCREDIDGCVFALALEGLRDEGFDSEPVIITVKNPDAPPASNMDHAIVVLDTP